MSVEQIHRHAGVWGRAHDEGAELHLRLVGPPVGRPQQWPRVAAFEWARHTMARLGEDLDAEGMETPTHTAQLKLMNVLRSVLAENSVFPTITYDARDELLVAEWCAGARSIELEIGRDGDVHYRVYGAGGALVYEGVSETQIRRLLRDLSAAVARNNPKWRRLFNQRRR